MIQLSNFQMEWFSSLPRHLKLSKVLALQILDKEKARLLRSMQKEKEHDSKVDSAIRAFEEAHGESQRLLREQQALLDQGEVEMLHGIGMGKGGTEDTEHEHEDGEITGARRKVAWGDAEEQGTEVRLFLSVSIQFHRNHKVNSYSNQ